MTASTVSTRDAPHAYILLAHRDPAQVLRLVDRLCGERSWVFVHVDARTPAPVFQEIAEGLTVHPHAQLLDRTPVSWGGWGIVEAMHTGFRAVLAAPCAFSHAVVISGHDYPLRPAEDIARFLEDHRGCSFLIHNSVPSRYYGPDGGVRRLTAWHQPLRGRRVSVPLWRRTIPDGVRPAVGSGWFCLSSDAVAHLVAFRASNPQVARYFRHVWAPDEHYVHCVLTAPAFAGRVICEQLWHIEWTRPGASHPDVLTLDAFDRLARSAREGGNMGGDGRAKLWARKFDLDHHGAVLDRIDRELLARPN